MKTSYDHLTGFPIRGQLDEYLDKELERAKKQKTMLGLLFIDLDRFRRINETFGYQCGDQILKTAAKRLKQSVQQRHMISRIAGDSFIVLLPDMQSESEARAIAEQIVKNISLPIAAGDKEMFITCSIGISIYPADGTSRNDLIRHAASAMIQAKNLGRNNSQRYQQLAHASKCASEDVFQLENDLRRAIDRNEFVLHYQPLFNRKKEIIGTEALIRWLHPERGLISPGEFIPLAEESGLILEINEWVLRQACLQNMKWQKMGFPRIPVAVNISLLHFQQKNLVRSIQQILLETNLHPADLQLELTENIFIYDPEQALHVLQQLRDLGIRLSLDDFGTGFSSLNYLKRFPLDFLKIDRSFIKDIVQEAKDQAIVQAIIHLAHNLSLKVVAEGVETQEQLQYLQSQRCDHFQGFLLGKPVPPHALAWS